MEAGPARAALIAMDYGQRLLADRLAVEHEEVEVTVLDIAVVGSDRDDTWTRVERLRGRMDAPFGLEEG